ncbi:MAG: DegV family protein [Lachnospiraceae bacterium]|nr:DegV family protein [Lachnospiraceae bacterium]
MSKIAIMTDSNSGITQEEAKALGIHVLPMPFLMGEETFFEDINLTQNEFYEKLKGGCSISTSQPSPESVLTMFDTLLREYDEVVHIPMSSGLSGSCETAYMLSQDYDGKVQVVNNQRISVTLRQSVMEAMELAQNGKTAVEIKEILEQDKLNSSIYIMLDTLEYLKKGGRITPAAAALGTILKLKPVLTIQGEKLDAFAKARTSSQGKKIMINAIKNDIEQRFGGMDKVRLQMAYTYDEAAAAQWKEELEQEFKGMEIVANPLSLSVACHIGPGALAVACTKILSAQ